VLVPAPAEPTDRGDEIVDAGDAARLGIGENRTTRDTPAAKRASTNPSTLADWTSSVAGLMSLSDDLAVDLTAARALDRTRPSCRPSSLPL
jgi:hypothetical protein